MVIAAHASLLAASGGETLMIDPSKLSYTWGPEFGTGMTDEADALATLVQSGALTRETALQLVERIGRREAEEQASGHEDQQAQGGPQSGTPPAE